MAGSGGGPSLLECKTYRFYDHVGRDFGVLQRDEAEVAYWRSRDPIHAWQGKLAEMSVLDAAQAKTMHEEVVAEMAEAIEWAEAQPDPEPGALYEDVYTEVSA